MEKIFESYVAAKLRRYLPSAFAMRTQDNQYYLFEHPTKTFGLRPDIVLAENSDIFIMDTKWKLLSENKRNYGISPSDMYQMYVYGKKYDAGKVVLLYPQQDGIRESEISFQSNDGVLVEVWFIDLLHPDISLSYIVNRLSSDYPE